MIGSTLFGGTAVTALLIAWGNVRTFAARLWSVAFVTCTVDGVAAQAVQSLLWEEWGRSPFGSQRYVSFQDHVRPLRRVVTVVAERVGTTSVIYWRRGRPLFVGVGRSAKVTGNNGESAVLPDDNLITVTCVRGTIDVEALIVAATDRYNDRTWLGGQTRFSVQRLFGAGCMQQATPERERIRADQNAHFSSQTDSRLLRWRREEVGPKLPPPGRGPFSDLALCFAATRLVEEVRRWHASETWYRERGIPWTRGVLLYGPPGTGKTSLVRSIALALNVPVFILDLSTMSNHELNGQWEHVRSCAPCVALIEDIDRVFKGDRNVNRTSTSAGQHLTFDCLLNVLGGIDDADGVLKVATTNNIEDLDPALGVVGEDGISSRPGRFDVAVYLGLMGNAQRQEVAERICVDCPDEINGLVDAGKGDTPARFVERCRAVALRRYWEESAPGTPGDAILRAIDIAEDEPESSALLEASGA